MADNKNRRLAQAVGALGVALPGVRDTTGAVVLAFHDVRPQRRDSSPYEVTSRDLRRQLHRVVALGYRFVPLQEVVSAHLRGEQLDGAVAVTFDDGYSGFSDVVAPVLADMQAPATLFVPSDALGEHPWWWPEAPRLLTTRELVEVAALPGVSIGAHGRRHVSLPSLPPEGQRDELAGSKARLEDLLGGTVDTVAYPYGEYSAITPGVARDAGYTAAFTFMNGRITPGASAFLLPRIVMHRGQRGPRLSYTLARSDSSFRPHQLLDVIPPQ